MIAIGYVRKSRLRAVGGGIVAAMLLWAPSVWADEPISLAGTYEFTSLAQLNHLPVCIERWQFKPDGAMTVYSGQEVIAKHFRIEHPQANNVLVTRYLDTNGKPDCTGSVESRHPEGEDRTYLAVSENGSISTSKASGASPSAMVLIIFGAIRRVPDAKPAAPEGSGGIQQIKPD